MDIGIIRSHLICSKTYYQIWVKAINLESKGLASSSELKHLRKRLRLMTDMGDGVATACDIT